jgi:hypothetical protein
LLEHFASVVAKHKGAAIVLDSNLLLLLVVGRLDLGRIEKFSRTSMFTKKDFETLKHLISNFTRIVTTPNVLTEVSNFVGQLENPARKQCFELLSNIIAVVEERFIASEDATADRTFLRLGLTDATISRLADSPFPVLTTDFDLWRSLSDRGIDALNFNHIRAQAW